MRCCACCPRFTSGEERCGAFSDMVPERGGSTWPGGGRAPGAGDGPRSVPAVLDSMGLASLVAEVLSAEVSRRGTRALTPHALAPSHLAVLLI